MSIEVDNVEEKAVHSWSRLSSAGQKALEEALRVFNPMSKDLSDTETQLVAFLQGLREEGYQPTILRSKDVYGYSSCTARMPSQAKGPGSQDPSSAAASASESAEAPATSIARIAKVSTPLARITVSPSEDSARPLSKSTSATNLLLNSLKRTRSGTSRATAVGFPAHMYPGVYPAMRLSVVLEALVPLKATASCLESKCKQGHLEISPSDLKLLKAAGASQQPPAVRAPKVAPIQLDPRACRHLIKKRPEPAPLTVSLLKGPKGEGPRAGSACKASAVLNGRLAGSASRSGGGTAASRTKEPPASRAELPGGRGHREAAGPKRRRPGEGQERPCQKKPSSPPSPGQTELASEASHPLERRTIKVDRSSDDELRRRAQEILRVNLSPVIRIQPLPQPHGVP